MKKENKEIISSILTIPFFIGIVFGLIFLCNNEIKLSLISLIVSIISIFFGMRLLK